MKARAQAVLGHTINEPRLTSWAYLWLLMWVGLPVTLVGMLLDLLAQWMFGVCTGLWCMV